MDTIVYYLETQATQSMIEWMHAALPLFPATECKRIVRYRYYKDQLLTFAGRLLLLKALKDLSLSSMLSLNDLKYTAFNRPFLDYPLDFNITHSGCYTMLALTTTGAVGIDIEKIAPIDMEAMRNVFTKKEWEALIHEGYDEHFFYGLWTRKEAVVKIAGKGLYIAPGKVEVTGNPVQIGEYTCWLQPIELDKQYVVHIATTRALASHPTPLRIGLEECIQECLPPVQILKHNHHESSH